MESVIHDTSLILRHSWQLSHNNIPYDIMHVRMYAHAGAHEG